MTHKSEQREQIGQRDRGQLGLAGILLEASGVESVAELSQRVPENIVNLFDRVNTMQRLSRSVPPLRTVQKWVQNAQTMQAAGERTNRLEARAKLTMTMAREVPSFPTPTRALLLT